MMFDDLPTLDRDALFSQLASGGSGVMPQLVVLCASARLAQHLHERYAAWQAQHGCTVWPTPDVLTPEAFLRRLAERVRPCRVLAGQVLLPVLSAAESELLWQRVVAETRHEAPLLREAEAARLAAEAWQLCHDYRLPLPLPASSPDVERFNAWSGAYRQHCVRLQRIDAAEERAQLIEQVERGELPVPADIVLAGFDDPLPWLYRLFEALRAAGVHLRRLNPPAHAAQIQAVVAPTADQELRAAAQWVAERARTDPQARLGVIVPDLDARRADVLRIFDETLCPALAALPARHGERPYNLTLGAQLADIGLVHTALALLRLCVEGLDWAQASMLLCAPYWGASEDEHLRRADIDRRLREQGHLHVDLPLLQQLTLHDEALQARWQQLCARCRAHGKADPGDWAERFSVWLEVAGWPGARPLDSAEYQAVQAWRELLRTLGTFGGIVGAISASEAYVQLEHLARQRVFQPQTPPVNIHVLGALEARGLDFDALWVVGLDDERWPAQGRPHPFIPFELQRRVRMPRASAAVALHWAERVTQGWRCCAREVVFSWPAMDEDRALAPSPLIHAEAAQATARSVDIFAPAWRAAARCGREVHLPDAYAPPPDKARVIPGGTRLLGDQARCPFRAFATHRLGVRALEEPGYGPKPIDRGVVVHRALETLWRDLRDQATLLALVPSELDARIGAAVDEALEHLARQAPQRLPPMLHRLEAERLRALLKQWMKIERERPMFTVEQLEGAAAETPSPDPDPDPPSVSFAGLRLRIRPDRIDRLKDGSRLVIDYKTGARRPPPWHDGRPEEPQLLLYALLESGVTALAYARIAAGAVEFEGLAADHGIAPGISRYSDCRDTRDAGSWDALLGRWRGELENLADEIRRGHASVTPKHPRQSCRDCHLHAACRIRERFGIAVGEDEDAP
ncbi:probable DNA repair protein [Fontimonas thermophila]|uniref:Probable DNA repair protein n=1 Tax=Fontimonas thermophila TaxID=1076937 RepID=A0A1I2J4U1_9GAMM|nr:PD-(D/E)XK nuclease family protein [Fontimonas thermophila]SFF47751.1 probable DNA repair protein [Fontimonas thermophila]